MSRSRSCSLHWQFPCPVTTADIGFGAAAAAGRIIPVRTTTTVSQLIRCPPPPRCSSYSLSRPSIFNRPKKNAVQTKPVGGWPVYSGDVLNSCIRICPYAQHHWPSYLLVRKANVNVAWVHPLCIRYLNSREKESGLCGQSAKKSRRNTRRITWANFPPLIGRLRARSVLRLEPNFLLSWVHTNNARSDCTSSVTKFKKTCP